MLSSPAPEPTPGCIFRYAQRNLPPPEEWAAPLLFWSAFIEVDVAPSSLCGGWELDDLMSPLPPFAEEGKWRSPDELRSERDQVNTAWMEGSGAD